MKENFKGFCTVKGAKRCKRAFIKTGWLRPSHTALRYGLYFLLSPAAHMCPCVQLTMLDTTCFLQLYWISGLGLTGGSFVAYMDWQPSWTLLRLNISASINLSICICWIFLPSYLRLELPRGAWMNEEKKEWSMQKSVTREKTVTCFPFLSVLRQLHCAYHLFPTWRFSEGFIFIVRPKHGKTTVYYAFLIKISKQEMSNWVLVHTCLGHLLTPWFGCTVWIDTMFLATLLNQWARPHWRIFCSIYGLTNLLDTITVI